MPPPSITTSTYKLKDDPQHQIENAIRKYEHDTMRNLIHYQSDKNVEFRTNKPRLSKKLCEYLNLILFNNMSKGPFIKDVINRGGRGVCQKMILLDKFIL